MLRVYVDFERRSENPEETRRMLTRLGVDEAVAEKLSRYHVEVAESTPRSGENVAVYLAGEWRERVKAAVVYARAENAPRYLAVIAEVPDAPQPRVYLAINLLPVFKRYCEEHGDEPRIVFGPCIVRAANPLP